MNLLYIPEIGTQVTLATDWTFDLYCEGRNDSLMTALVSPLATYASWWANNGINELAGSQAYAAQHNLAPVGYHSAVWPKCPLPIFSIQLPAGTVLSVDRVYIRKGMRDFSSITFRVVSSPDARLKKRMRFWAKLADVNAAALVVS